MAQDARESFFVPTLAPTSSLIPTQELGAHTPIRAYNDTSEKSARPITAGTDGSASQSWPFHVRTLPPWVRSHDVPEDDPDASTRLLPTEIHDALVAQHNHSPYDTSKQERNKRIRLETDGVDSIATASRESRWKLFAQSAAYLHAEAGAEEKRVTFEWLNNNLGDYSQPWNASNNISDAELGRATWTPRTRSWIERLQMRLLRSPIVPLILRLTVWMFSLCALALGSSIYHYSHRLGRLQDPSTYMAIIVDAVALVYLVYITYDEYASKPLGLRSPRAKVRLILLDLFFIVFDAANLSLAFESLNDAQGSCTNAVINDEPIDKNDILCDRQKALASVLLVALIAWLLTFSVSVFRLVERVSK